MPTPTLPDVDLTDHDPPIPGERERAAVRARAGQIARRRRLATGAGVLGAGALVIGLGAAALLGGSGGSPAKVSMVVVQTATTSVEPGATVTVRLMNDEGSFSGQADANGTVEFEHDIAPGSYSVFVTVDSSAATPRDGVDIGTALRAFSSPKITLEAGVNTLDLSTLHQETATAPIH
jgi:hypothetical protein